MIKVRRFVIASSASDALLHAGAWERHPEIRASLEEGHVFEDAGAARTGLAELIQRVKDESPFGCGVPCDEHSRCAGFDPQVWEVELSITPVKS